MLSNFGRRLRSNQAATTRSLTPAPFFRTLMCALPGEEPLQEKFIYAPSTYNCDRPEMIHLPLIGYALLMFLSTAIILIHMSPRSLYPLCMSTVIFAMITLPIMLLTTKDR